MPVLKARIGGTWVDVGGAGTSEVEIGTADPIGANPAAELWYDTDAAAVLSNDMRWNTAWGRIGYAEITANGAAITTETFVPGLSSTVTLIAGRIYRVTGYLRVGWTVANDRIIMRVKDGANAIALSDVMNNSGSSHNPNLIAQVLLASSGTKTYSISLERTTGTGTATPRGDPTHPSFIVVEDLGPQTVGVSAAQPSGPKGTVAFAQLTSNSAAITAITDIGGLAVNFAATPDRRYRTSLTGVWQGNVAGDLIIAMITDGVGAVRYQQHHMVTPGGYAQINCSVVETGLSGTIQRKAQHQRYAGGGTSTILAGAAYPAYIMVEDLGAV